MSARIITRLGLLRPRPKLWALWDLGWVQESNLKPADFEFASPSSCRFVGVYGRTDVQRFRVFDVR